MIFNKDYDSSLWNIIVVDRENRKDLVDFIKEIPEELFHNIKFSIDSMKKI